MAKVKTKNNTGTHTTTAIIWEYQLTEGGWVPEDDERSASYKAINNTGRIRYQEQTTTRNLDNGTTTITSTPWTTYHQKLIK